jgi:hypothetical protein
MSGQREPIEPEAGDPFDPAGENVESASGKRADHRRETCFRLSRELARVRVVISDRRVRRRLQFGGRHENPVLTEVVVSVEVPPEALELGAVGFLVA